MDGNGEKTGESVWPPAPTAPHPGPQPTRAGERWADGRLTGRIAITLSSLGTLCWAKDALTDDPSLSEAASALWNTLAEGGLALLALGLILGIIGWRSASGKTAIGLALVSPFWLFLLLWLHPFGTIH